jgi:hypothetical protein
MSADEEQLKILAAKASLEWRDGVIQFDIKAHHMSEVRAVQSAARALADGRVTQTTLDWMDALVAKHMQQGYHAFARDASGQLIHTGDDMHRGRVSDGMQEGQRAPDWVLKLASLKPEPIQPMPEEARGLYLMAYTVKQQLNDVASVLGSSQRLLDKNENGQMCIGLPSVGGCRYIVEAADTPPSTPNDKAGGAGHRR